MHTVFNQGLWAASALLLFVVALVRFNRPPTNRTGTTFLLFYTGVLFYYALLIGLWLLVIVLLSAGTYGVDGIGPAVSLALKTNEWLNPSVPVVGLLVIAVASQFKLVGRMDAGARQLCIQLAAIPAEAEQLAVELAHGELELKDRALIESISNDITTNISANALRFANDGSLASRFTRAVSIYWLFIMPDNAGTPVVFPAGLSGRSAYTRIMRLNEKAVEQSIALYESLMENALAYFTSSKPTRQMEDALKKSVQALSQSVCRLIARYVLYLDVTESKRRWRLSTMGLNPRDHSPAFSLDQWVASILAIIILFMFLSLLIPGRLPFSQSFMYSVLMAIQLGMAVIAGTVVAQRFIRRQEDHIGRFPPLAELTASALVVVGLCIVLRIGWPVIQDLLTAGNMSLNKSVAQFKDRWPFVILPFVCTLSIGLISAYASLLPWSWIRLSLVGGVLNAAAFAAASLLIGNLLTDGFLIQLHGTAGTARVALTESLSIAGFVLGSIVLAIFPRSIRFGRTKTNTGAPSTPLIADLALTTPNPLTDTLAADPNISEPRRASKDLGGYSREGVEDLEGRYVCFRPTFSNPAVINAYEIVIRWDERRACLVFEERNRPDSVHSQIGPVYLPDGRPFMNLVTIDKGALRIIMVTRTDDAGIARGLVLTLSNPGGVHFVPATAPLVLRRLKEATPQLGFVHPDAPDYALYLHQLRTVVPEFATLASVASSLKVVHPSVA